MLNIKDRNTLPVCNKHRGSCLEGMVVCHEETNRLPDGQYNLPVYIGSIRQENRSQKGKNQLPLFRRDCKEVEYELRKQWVWERRLSTE